MTSSIWRARVLAIIAAAFMVGAPGGASGNALFAGEALTAAASPLVIWHTLDGHSARFFAELMTEFSAHTGIRVRVETGMDLVPALIESLDGGTPPDAVLAPVDLMGLAKSLDLSLVPPGFLGALRLDPHILSAVTTQEKIYAAPIIDGNVLLLLYNKLLIKTPSVELSRGPAVAWVYDDRYVALSFLRSLLHSPQSARETESMDFCASKTAPAALTDYARLLAGQEGERCDYSCVTSDFYNGKRAQVLNGDWALRDAEDALGENLGVAPLPAIFGARFKSLRSPQALFFPAQVLHGPRAAKLAELVKFLQSFAVQRRWYHVARRLPIDERARAEVLATGGQTARVLFGEVERGNLMPVSASFWPAFSKGLRLYLRHVLAADATVEFMQKLASRGSPDAERAPL